MSSLLLTPSLTNRSPLSLRWPLRLSSFNNYHYTCSPIPSYSIHLPPRSLRWPLRLTKRRTSSSSCTSPPAQSTPTGPQVVLRHHNTTTHMNTRTWACTHGYLRILAYTTVLVVVTFLAHLSSLLSFPSNPSSLAQLNPPIQRKLHCEK